MKRRRVELIVVAVALSAAVAWVITVYLKRPQPSFGEAVRIVRAMDAFSRAREQRGQPPTNSVELRELVEGGFITADEARRFSGTTVTFLHSEKAAGLQDLQDAARSPSIRLQLRDGRKIVMMADGTVHAFKR